MRTRLEHLLRMCAVHYRRPFAVPSAQTLATRAAAAVLPNVITEANVAAVLREAFPQNPALPAGTFCSIANDMLLEVGHTRDNTLFAASCCADEINRLLEEQMEMWGSPFALGGLAGFPFVGKTGFVAFESHKPDNGRLFILCASHVGVSEDGIVGSCNRRGMREATLACGSAIGAYRKLKADGLNAPEPSVDEAFSGLDMQQLHVSQIVKRNFQAIDSAANPMAKLALVLGEENYRGLKAIIPPSYDQSEITILAGVQVNTLTSLEDFFIPLHFEVRAKDGNVQNLMPSLLERMNPSLVDAVLAEIAFEPTPSTLRRVNKPPTVKKPAH
eukprot:m.34402 g.34402  ORF g.34402 m.34402 type:complete len:330 (+) comp11011_c3_seq1:293-1282(+)